MTVSLAAPEDTERFGRVLGALLQPGDTLALVGDLGAGKTTLTQAIARGMGITAPVTSPTFTLVHEYPGPLPLFHFDTYRFDSPEDVADIGFEEYFERGGVVIIEWADRIVSLLPAERLTLCLFRGVPSPPTPLPDSVAALPGRGETTPNLPSLQGLVITEEANPQSGMIASTTEGEELLSVPIGIRFNEDNKARSVSPLPGSAATESGRGVGGEGTPRNWHEENRVLTISSTGTRHQALLEQLKSAPEIQSLIVEEEAG